MTDIPTAGPGPCKCQEKYLSGLAPGEAEFFRITKHLPGCPNALHVLRERRQALMEKYLGAAGTLLSGAIQDRAGLLVVLFDPLSPDGWKTYFTNARKEAVVGAMKELMVQLENTQERKDA